MSMPSRSRTGSGPLVAGVLVAAVVVVVLVVFAIGGVTPDRLIQSFFPPAPTTDRGRDVMGLYDLVFAFAVVIFLAVEAWIVIALVRYRRKPGDDELPPQTHGNTLVEVIWTVIPTVIVAILFFFSWQTLNKVEAKTPPQVRITAEAARFQWTFHYYDENGKEVFVQPLALVEANGGMVIPVGQPIQITLRSPDVIHAFYVPKFLFKRDVVPGKENIFDFTVEEAGTYRGQCAELCGVGHGAMLFDVKAVSPAEYQTWYQEQVSKAQASPPPPEPSGGSGQPAPSGAPGATVQLAAQNTAFAETALEAPANAPFTIAFNNQDNGIPHNVEIQAADGSTPFKGDIISGPKEVQYSVPPLPAGQYTFVCIVHPQQMTGTLTVK